MLNQNESDIEIVVDKKLVRFGMDPYMILIDRERNNSLAEVKRK
jgi:hypothetical protein